MLCSSTSRSISSQHNCFYRETFKTAFGKSVCSTLYANIEIYVNVWGLHRHVNGK